MAMDPIARPPRLSPTRPPARPVRDALVLAIAYSLVGALYIRISSGWAASSAASVEELARIETLKGIAFVAGTSIGLYLLAFFLLRSLRDREVRLLEQMDRVTRAEENVVAGMFAASVAQDINSSLVVADLELDELAEREGLDDRGRELVRRTRTAFRHIRDLSRALEMVGQDRVRRPAELYDVGEVLQSAIDVVVGHESLRGVEILATIEAELPRVWGSPGLLMRAMLNLLVNAGEAVGDASGRIQIEARETRRRVLIEVSDSGPGIPDREMEPIGEWYRSPTTRVGDGAGLLSVKLCAAEHGGRVEVDRSPTLGGSRFRLELLAAPETGPSPDGPPVSGFVRESRS